MDSWTDMTVQSTENTTMDNYTKSSFSYYLFPSLLRVGGWTGLRIQ